MAWDDTPPTKAELSTSQQSKPDQSDWASTPPSPSELPPTTEDARTKDLFFAPPDLKGKSLEDNN